MKRFHTPSRLFALVSNAIGRRRVLSSVVFALWLAVPSVAYSQNLDDFKNAAGKKGVESIPFKSLQDDAAKLNEEVQKLKEEAKPVLEVELFEKQKTNLLTEIKDLKAALEQEMAAVNKIVNSDEATATLLAKEIKQCAEDVEKINNTALKNLNEKMAKGADACARFAEARGKLREKFDEVKKTLDEAKANPDKYLGSGASDEDKKKLGEYTDSIKAGIESEEAEHAAQEKGSKEKAAALQALAAKTE